MYCQGIKSFNHRILKLKSGRINLNINCSIKSIVCNGLALAGVDGEMIL